MSFAEDLRLLPMRARLVRADSQTDDRPGWNLLFTPSRRSDRFNEIEIAGDVAGDVLASIDAAVADYRAAGVDFKLAVYPGPRASEITDHIDSYGLASWWARGMWCSTDQIAEVPDAVEVDVVGAADRERYVELAAAAWQMDAPADDAERFTNLAVRRYIARAGGLDLGVAAVTDVGELAYLCGAAVHPERRGRGGYRALVAARLAGAKERGIERAGTHAREQTSAPILEALGFATAFRYRMFGSRAPA